MLVPNVPMEYFEDYGFKKCKGSYERPNLFYLCIRNGCKVLFVSKTGLFTVKDWEENDPRIHEKPNCRYSDNRDYLDIIYDLIIKGMLTSEKEIKA